MPNKLKHKSQSNPKLEQNQTNANNPGQKSHKYTNHQHQFQFQTRKPPAKPNQPTQQTKPKVTKVIGNKQTT